MSRRSQKDLPPVRLVCSVRAWMFCLIPLLGLQGCRLIDPLPGMEARQGFSDDCSGERFEQFCETLEGD